MPLKPVHISSAGGDASREQLAARRARFAGQAKKAAAARAAPSKPRMCHPGGVITSNKDFALRKFMQRKGLTPQQASEARQREEAMACKRAAVRAPAAGQKENGCAEMAMSEERQLKKLRGKVRDIEALQAKIAAGTIVHVNRPMQQKIAKLPGLQAQIKALLR